MLRYKNSLLERILLEKGAQHRTMSVFPHAVNTYLRQSSQVLMYKLSFEPKLEVRILVQLMCPRTWCNHRQSDR
jgi:hypothetical protein